MLMFYSVQTTSSTMVGGENEMHSKQLALRNFK